MANDTHLYRHFDADGALLYVGISLNALNRLAQHRDHAHWFVQIKRVEIEQFQSRREALAAEKSAILREKPLHNVKRPSAEEQKTVERVETSKADLLARIVRFNPTYSVDEAAEVLGLKRYAVRDLIESGELFSIEIPRGPYKPITAITGWQLIDYLETLEARAVKKRSVSIKEAA